MTKRLVVSLADGGVPPYVTGLRFSLRDFAWLTDEVSSVELPGVGVSARCRSEPVSGDGVREKRNAENQVTRLECVCGGNQALRAEVVTCIQTKETKNDGLNCAGEKESVTEQGADQGPQTEVKDRAAQEGQSRSCSGDRPVTRLALFSERGDILRQNTAENAETHRSEEADFLSELPKAARNISEEKGIAPRSETRECGQAKFYVSPAQDYLRAWLGAAAHHLFRQYKRHAASGTVFSSGVLVQRQQCCCKHVLGASAIGVSKKPSRAQRPDISWHRRRSCQRKRTLSSSLRYFATKYGTSATQRHWIRHILRSVRKWGSLAVAKRRRLQKKGGNAESAGGWRLGIRRSCRVAEEEGAFQGVAAGRRGSANECGIGAVNGMERGHSEATTTLNLVSRPSVPSYAWFSSSLLKQLLPRQPIHIEYHALALHASAVANQECGEDGEQDRRPGEQGSEVPGERRDNSAERSREDQGEQVGGHKEKDATEQPNDGEDKAERQQDQEKNRRVDSGRNEGKQGREVDELRGEGLSRGQEGVPDPRQARYLARQKRLQMLEREQEERRVADERGRREEPEKKSTTALSRERKRGRARETRAPCKRKMLSGCMAQTGKSEGEEAVDENRPGVKTEEVVEGMKGGGDQDGDDPNRSVRSKRNAVSGLAAGKNAREGNVVESEDNGRVRRHASRDREGTDCPAVCQGGDNAAALPKGGYEDVTRIIQKEPEMQETLDEASKKRQPRRQNRKRIRGQQAAQNALDLKEKKVERAGSEGTEKIVPVLQQAMEGQGVGEGQAEQLLVSKRGEKADEQVAKLGRSSMFKGRKATRKGVGEKLDQTRDSKDEERRQQGIGDSAGVTREENEEDEGLRQSGPEKKMKKKAGVQQHSVPSVPRPRMSRDTASKTRTSGRSSRPCTSRRSACSSGRTLGQGEDDRKYGETQLNIIEEEKKADESETKEGKEQHQSVSLSCRSSPPSTCFQQGEGAEKAAEEDNRSHEKTETTEESQGSLSRPLELISNTGSDARSEKYRAFRDATREQADSVVVDQGLEKITTSWELEWRRPSVKSESESVKDACTGVASTSPPSGMSADSWYRASSVVVHPPLSSSSSLPSLFLAPATSISSVPGAAQDPLTKVKDGKQPRGLLEKAASFCVKGTTGTSPSLAGGLTVPPQARGRRWNSDTSAGSGGRAALRNQFSGGAVISTGEEREAGPGVQEEPRIQTCSASPLPVVPSTSSFTAVSAPPSDCNSVFPSTAGLLSPASRSVSPSPPPRSFLLASSVHCSCCPSSPAMDKTTKRASSPVSTPSSRRGDGGLSHTSFMSAYSSSSAPSVTAASRAVLPQVQQQPVHGDCPVFGSPGGSVADRELALSAVDVVPQLFVVRSPDGGPPLAVSSELSLEPQIRTPAKHRSRTPRGARGLMSGQCQPEASAQSSTLRISGAKSLSQPASSGPLDHATDAGIPGSREEGIRSQETIGTAANCTSSVSRGRKKEVPCPLNHFSLSSPLRRTSADCSCTCSSCHSSSSVDAVRPVRLLSGNIPVLEFSAGGAAHPSLTKAQLAMLLGEDRVPLQQGQDVRPARAAEVDYEAGASARCLPLSRERRLAKALPLSAATRGKGYLSRWRSTS